jgi:cell division protein FtsQ
VAGRRRDTQARPPRARAAVAVLPRRRARVASRLGRFAPSRRSLAAGLGLAALVVGAYAAARESSAFAIRAVDVAGAPPGVERQVRRALAPLVGTSLLALDGATLERRLEALPAVVSVSYDRAFPHTLSLDVVPETPVAVLHRGGRDTWLVSARGRVLARIPKGTEPALARIWVPQASPVRAGAFLGERAGGTTARALGLAARFPARIAVAALAHGELVFRLRSGVEVRLGAPTDVRLKLAIARRALRRLPPGATYVDVSVPQRPVAGAVNLQLSGRD